MSARLNHFGLEEKNHMDDKVKEALGQKLAEIAVAALENKLGIVECKDKEGNGLFVLYGGNENGKKTPFATVDLGLIDKLKEPKIGADIVEAKFNPPPMSIISAAAGIIRSAQIMEAQEDTFGLNMGFTAGKKPLVN